jgi:hypothetical protein
MQKAHPPAFNAPFAQIFHLLRLEKAFEIAVGSLKLEDRKSLLSTMMPFPHDYLIITPLIGDSVELYQYLLANRNMKLRHLDPLCGKPTDGWALKAIAAVNAGYSLKEITYATINPPHMRIVLQTGKESEIWADWIKSFEAYLSHSDERIREIAKISIENARYRQDNALREEFKEAVFGRNY